MAISRQDVQAALDVVNQLMAEIDDLDAQGAIEMRKEVQALQKAAGDCASLLETRAVNALDGQPIRVGDTVYTTKREGKWRPDQTKVAALVVQEAMCSAADKETGEIDAHQAVVNAIDMMIDGYVAPSQKPKAGLLKRLGVDNQDVSTWERGRKVLKGIEVEKEPEDD